MIVNKNRKGISTFIATLLLMVLAVSAGVVIYAYTMGYLGGFGGPQTMGALSIDASAGVYDPDDGDTVISVYIRNIGKSSFQADTVYIEGQLLNSTGTWVAKPGDKPMGAEWRFIDTTDGNSIIEEGHIGLLEIRQNTDIKLDDATTTTDVRFIDTTTYEIKMIGKDNTQLSFSVKVD